MCGPRQDGKLNMGVSPLPTRPVLAACGSTIVLDSRGIKPQRQIGWTEAGIEPTFLAYDPDDFPLVHSVHFGAGMTWSDALGNPELFSHLYPTSPGHFSWGQHFKELLAKVKLNVSG